MNIGKLGRWGLKQALGTKRGEAAIALLEGPVGALLALAVGALLPGAALYITRLENRASDLADEFLEEAKKAGIQV